MNNGAGNELELELEKELDAYEGSAGGEIFDPSKGAGHTPNPLEEKDIFGEDSATHTFIPGVNPSFTEMLLNTYGIDNNSTFSVEDEEGNEVNLKFSELSDEEKITVISELSTPDNNEDLKVNQSDFDYYKELTSNGISLKEAVDFLADKKLQEIQENQLPVYEIDSYDDDQLFFLDMKNEFPDLTDEEIISELEKAKENPIIFKKKSDKLRSDYKNLEEEYKEIEQNRLLAEQEESYNKLVSSVSAEAQNINSFEGIDIDLDTEDKQEVLDFLFTKDTKGQTAFAKLLENPKELFRIAWLAKKGKEAFSGIQDYYKSEISKRATNAPKVVTKTPNGKKELTIDDLYFN